MIEVKDLSVQAGDSFLLKNISLVLSKGEAVGLTGASGAGKSTLLRTLFGILPRSCRMTAKALAVDGINLSTLSRRKHRDLCGKVLGFIPQKPMTAFNRRKKIGNQLLESICLRMNKPKKEAMEIIIEAMEKTRLTDPCRLMASYPGQLSGGMLQRVAIAVLLAMDPAYILADEPTSALDEENRNVLLELLRKQQSQTGILLVSHDVEALQILCSRVYVLDQGQLIEEAHMSTLLSQPQAEWTKSFAETYWAMRRGTGSWKDL